jgi:antitoxin MazE
MIITQLKRWGNSLAIRLPQNLLSQVNLQENEDIEIRVENNTIILNAAPKHKYLLDDLLSKITPENKQDLVDFGKPVGKEIW